MLILAAMLLLTATMPAFATGDYEISDRIMKTKDIGTAFYPGVTTYEALQTLFNSETGGDIRSAVVAKCGMQEYWYCIVGERNYPEGEVYFIQ